MRYAVLGAGGVGGLVGGALAKAGQPVTLLVRSGRRDHYPERLTVESETLGTFEAPVRVADQLDGQFDVVWITVKATALEAALRTVSPEKLDDGVVVPLLNGVDHVEQLRDRYGAERVLPGTIQVEAEQIGHGRVRHLSAFANMQVAPRPATQARAEVLCKELRGAGLGCEVREDEITMLWSKLCFWRPLRWRPRHREDRSGWFARTRHGGPGWKDASRRHAPSGSRRGPRSPPTRSSRHSRERPRVSGARCKKTWRRGGRLRLRLSRDPSSAAALSTASTCQRPAPSWTGSWSWGSGEWTIRPFLAAAMGPVTLRRSLSRPWCCLAGARIETRERFGSMVKAPEAGRGDVDDQRRAHRGD